MKNGIEAHKYYFLLEWKDKNLSKFQEMFGEGKRLLKERMFEPSDDGNGYLHVSLKNAAAGLKPMKIKIHTLVAMHFLGHKREGRGPEFVVDHIDNNKKNNNVSNLQIISQRENCSKDQWRHNRASKYVGVTSAGNGKWRAVVVVGKSKYHIGIFDTEEEARDAYLECLNDIDNFDFNKYRKVPCQ